MNRAPDSIAETAERAAEAVAAVPAGAWAVAVSGGADSVALLELLAERATTVAGAGLSLHVVHLDHETRGEASAGDAAFVRELAARHGLPATIARRGEIEPLVADLPNNPSARFRALRLALFRRTVDSQGLLGVILAHHADDQAETVLQRLLRGSGTAGLGGMEGNSVVSGVRVLRPLLGVRRAVLRAVLRGRGVRWREDASNRSMQQQRNRARAALAGRDELVAALLEVGRASAAWTRWLRESGPALGEQFEVAALRGVAPPIAREAARQWLAARAAAGTEIPPAAVEQLLAMIDDAATPPRQHFPGGVLVWRRGGIIGAEQRS